jgi:copper chaperone CopZ
MEKKKVIMVLDQLQCPDCAMKIAMVLRNVKGVTGAEVLYTTSKVKIDYDPEAAKPEDFVNVIEKIGYHVKEVKQ